MQYQIDSVLQFNLLVKKLSEGTQSCLLIETIDKLFEHCSPYNIL